MRKFTNFFIGAIFGGLLGVSAALLLAPAPGKNIRGQVSDYSKRFKDEILLAYDQRRAELEEELNKLRQPKF